MLLGNAIALNYHCRQLNTREWLPWGTPIECRTPNITSVALAFKIWLQGCGASTPASNAQPQAKAPTSPAAACAPAKDLKNADSGKNGAAPTNKDVGNAIERALGASPLSLTFQMVISWG